MIRAQLAGNFLPGEASLDCRYAKFLPAASFEGVFSESLYFAW